MNETSKAAAEAARALEEKVVRQARQDYLSFVRYTHQEGRYNVGRHHRIMARKLQTWADPDSDLNRLAVFMPPQHGKTTQTSVHLPPWIFGHNADARIIAGSYGEDPAVNMSRSAKQVMLSDQYNRVFPDTNIPSKRVRSDERESTKNTDKHWEIVEGYGHYIARGKGQGVASYSADYLIIDDPLSRDQARSEAEREDCMDWYSRGMKTRLSKNGKVLLVQTRWHQEDLAGQLLTQSEDIERADKWEVLRFPAICEDPDAPNEWRDMGEPLWAVHKDLDELEEIRATQPHDFDALYQQKPTPPGGTVLDDEWIDDWRYEVMPDLRECDLKQSWDLRFGGEGSSSSYAVGTLWAQPWDEVNLYLIDVRRGRWGFHDTCDLIEDLQAHPDWGLANGILIEDEADGRNAIPTLRDKIGGIIPVPARGSKRSRLESCTPYFAAGNIRIPENSIVRAGRQIPPPDLSWVQPYMRELKSFDNVAHDDQVDATAHLVRHWLLSGTQARQVDDDEPVADTTVSEPTF